MSQPIHIVMTPTHNEAWVIRAFLESTTRWADYVIICDQFSTDGTRDIVAQYAALSRKLSAGEPPTTRVSSAQVCAKERFYMFVDWQGNHRPPYTMGRNYIGSNTYPNEQFNLPNEWIYTKEKDGWSLWDNVELDEPHC